MKKIIQNVKGIMKKKNNLTYNQVEHRPEKGTRDQWIPKMLNQRGLNESTQDKDDFLEGKNM